MKLQIGELVVYSSTWIANKIGLKEIYQNSVGIVKSGKGEPCYSVVWSCGETRVVHYTYLERL